MRDTYPTWFVFSCRPRIRTDHFARRMTSSSARSFLNPFRCRYTTLGSIICQIAVSISSTGAYYSTFSTLLTVARHVLSPSIHVVSRQAELSTASRRSVYRICRIPVHHVLHRSLSAPTYVIFRRNVSLTHRYQARIGAVDHGCGVNRMPPPNTSFIVASTFLCAVRSLHTEVFTDDEAASV